MFVHENFSTIVSVAYSIMEKLIRYGLQFFSVLMVRLEIEFSNKCRSYISVKYFCTTSARLGYGNDVTHRFKIICHFDKALDRS